jgi:hypothetical protein
MVEILIIKKLTREKARKFVLLDTGTFKNEVPKKKVNLYI